MEKLKRLIYSFRSSAEKTCLGLLLVFWASGCGTTPGPGATPADNTPQPGPQTYFAPYVAGTTESDFMPLTYTIDDKGNKFSQTIYELDPPGIVYSQVLNAGVFTVGQRNLRSLGITANYNPGSNTQTYNPPKPGSFAVELAGQTGGLVQLVAHPVEPLVAATQCPSQKTAQTYLFVTIPEGLSITGPQALAWDSTTDTAYGSVDISSSGSTVNFQNIRQFTLPSVGGSGAPAQPASSSQTGVCGPTSYGYITNVPGQLMITNPGVNQSASPQTMIGISTSGLLVENSRFNVLGAGSGSVGLPKSSGAVDTGAVVGAQYLGFIYSSGIFTSAEQPPAGWTSHVASFGFSNPPSGCASVAPKTSTLIYGGDFPNDDPSTSQDGFGNCDFAIDLGVQDASTNGLYPHATVWVGANYLANTTGATYSFQAVAIAGQLNGKYAIFVIGVDPTQPWGIYLLQSN